MGSQSSSKGRRLDAFFNPLIMKQTLDRDKERKGRGVSYHNEHSGVAALVGFQ